MTKFPLMEAILSKTDRGLQIILDYYPEAAAAVQNSSKKFKIRTQEKTASASLKISEKGDWIVIDWGAWDKPENAIGVCMVEDDLTFTQACYKLAKLYNVQYKGISYTAKPIITRRPKTSEEVPGNYIFNYKEEISKSELLIIGPKVTNDTAKKFHLKSVKNYSYIKDDEIITTASTDDYPIFVYDFGDWQKIYQPKSADKSYRFRYAGGRPKDHIFGLDNVISAYKKLKTEDELVKLDQIIICSGDRDAINIASFGYYPIWLNSETAILSPEKYKELTLMSETIYNLPDIDKTGLKQAVKLGLFYMDIKTIWLPDYILKTKDWRGSPRKDFLDFLNLKFDANKPKTFSKILKKLIENALPMKFWDEETTNQGIKYHYNIVYAEHFLKHQGFCRMEFPYQKEEYTYIFIDGNTIRKTSANKIEYYINTFLQKRNMPIKLRNMVKKTPYLKESMMSKLELLDFDFKDHTAESQLWFFNNCLAEITQKDIVFYKEDDIPKKAMEDKVINFPINMNQREFEQRFNERHFKISKDTDGDDDINILVKDNLFLNYLINISRMHWRKDLEDVFKDKPEQERDNYAKLNKFNIAGKNLNADEILEQKQHLINKIFAIGYLLHKHKDKSKGWFVFGVDNKMSDIGESHGGTGKSLMFDYLREILKDQFFIPGRSKKAIDSEFLFDGVSTNTDYIFIDDMDQYFPFKQFFSDITGSMRIRPLHSKAYNLLYKESPKMCGTSNFVPQNLDSATRRRILFTINSDYYHENKDNEYLQTRRVSDDFQGRNLFDDFTEEEHVQFFVFCSQCVQFFMSSNRKIEPPMDTVNKRNLIAEMGDIFRNWAIVYFSDDNLKLDELISRTEAYEDYKRISGGKKSSNSFKKAIKAFCKFNNYSLNPSEIANCKDGRIIQRLNDSSGGIECFYIKTTADTPIKDVPTIDDNMREDSSNMPF